jgi:predicted transcriptional regulator
MQRLSKREQQICEILYRLGRGSVADVRAGMADAPSYSSVRAQLRILEEKGLLSHVEESGKYVYFPVESRDVAARGMMGRVVESFFGGRAGAAALSLLGGQGSQLTQAEIAELEALIARAKEEMR